MCKKNKKRCLKNQINLLTPKNRGAIFGVSQKDTERRDIVNKNELEAVMKRHGETGGSLAEYLGIARSTFSAKINETNGAEFTQGEISKIKAKFSLSAAEIDMIFFNPRVSL